VRRELAVSAEAGGPESVALAERLTAPLASVFQLALLEALSTAADEITRDLAPGSVEVRLRGGEPSFAVTAPPVESMTPPMASSVAPADSDEGTGETEGATARIAFRVPEQLKVRIEEAAAAQGRSVNAWLTRAASAALRAPGQAPAAEAPPSGNRWKQHYTGWVS
jgi:hypothetical protein